MYFSRMKKFIIGILCMGFILCTSVSFASDGPKTTKDCVVDNLDVMETAVIIDQEVMFIANNDNYVSCIVDGSDTSTFKIDFKALATKDEDIDFSRAVHLTRNKNFLNLYQKPTKSVQANIYNPIRRL